MAITLALDKRPEIIPQQKPFSFPKKTSCTSQVLLHVCKAAVSRVPLFQYIFGHVRLGNKNVPTKV